MMHHGEWLKQRTVLSVARDREGRPHSDRLTPDNSYFFAPSLTIKPDLDTTMTILASAYRNDTRLQGFLPYVGTAVNAPFGRIPTRLFAS